ncbi:NAD(P)/FAD-dependent oxidoreductase [Citreimonas salinaria]|uniref:Glycine/D-amino acid oxidase n=1 Tax=Citreimonas salinaria TaxID=321339 RepID=A0A1H3L5K6_9RHOB|nr:FAD-binding oxidoreductase [Citreimonas salinaria]SDY59228.1 Glycine/D-amino acid oxidase [Citreimonas salinaria]
MKRLYEPAAYGPQGNCWWAETVPNDPWPVLETNMRCEVAIIGGGFTGLSAALHLAQDGVDVALLEAEHPGWGASGRNGGFCCLGGAKAPRTLLLRRYGPEGLAEWRTAEVAAVELVDGLLRDHAIDVDRHSEGETLLAHTPKAWARMRADQDAARVDFGIAPTLIPRDGLRENGLGGPWHGAATMPIGFALNPRKYHAGLARAAQKAGALLFQDSAVTRLTRAEGGWRLDTAGGALRANRVLIATNGYTSDDLPDWIAGRTLPVQSSVIVTEPLGEDVLAAQGWTSSQMAYDTRHLLHYFRLMPDRRFLFGMRGGLRVTPRAQAVIARKIRADFARLFPAWQGVRITHEWAGLVCLMARLVPFAGAVPDHPGLFAGLGYHGNGVAMASYTGALMADVVQGRAPRRPWPRAMQSIPPRFPLGRFRRASLWPAYAMGEAFDL